MISDEKLIKLKMYVIDAIAANYQYSKYDAKNMVDSSAFIELLNDDPEFVFHYSVEYWAKEVMNENSLVYV